MKISRPASAAVMLTLVISACGTPGPTGGPEAASTTQTWDILIYDPREHRPWPAQLILKGPDSAATVETYRTTGMSDPCVGASKAAVERTATTITITKEPKMHGCNPIRYVIKADGTGGKVQSYRTEPNVHWVDDPRDRQLTLRK